MSAELNVTLDRRSLAKFRTLLKANRMMAAKSLTFVAYKARDEWRASFPTMFHLRRKWLITGARVEVATPNRLQSAVYHKDKYLDRHVKGLDTPKKAEGGRLFVPVQPIEQQGTHTQIRAMLRRADRTKRKTFRVRDMILRRMSKDRDSIKVLGVLRKSVSIKPRFDAVAMTERTVKREFPTVYEKLLRQWSEKG